MKENNNLSLSDLNDSTILRKNESLLSLLLKDHTTGKNIKWGTDSYINHGYSFRDDQEIKINLITGWYEGFIRPRVDKDIDIQLERQRNRAEVFTPSWVIKLQVDAALEDMEKLPLVDFIKTKWLEITCGEAPYMVNRYDMETGELKSLKERSGFIDVKFNRLNKKVECEEEWLKLALEIFKASYGYEYQGDSLLLARENLLLTFIDNYFYMFGAFPKDKLLKEVTEIISFNLFQMDGLTYEVPYSDGGSKEFGIQLSLFNDIEEEMPNPIHAKVKLWNKNKIIEFREISERNDTSMKFDVAIGNPPYNEQYSGGENNQTKPIYHTFMEAAYKISEKTLLITPARYLSNPTRELSKWSNNVLKDSHFKVIHYESDSSIVFPNVLLKGGVAVSYYDHSKTFDPIKIFIPQMELSSIYKKVVSIEGDKYSHLGELVYSPDSYRFSDTLFAELPELTKRTDKTHRKSVSSNVFERYPEIFFDKVDEDENYIQIYGRENSRIRKFKFVLRKYIAEHTNLNKWKVFVPGASGNGEFGEKLGDSIVANPKQGHNQTFISMGEFNSRIEAENLLKYLKSKFARALLGIRKTTHNNQSKKTWSMIPLQDFSVASSINWSKTISEIDKQLYEKYKLTEEEINFIEVNVKEMD